MESRKYSRTSCDLRAGCFWKNLFTFDEISNISEGGAFLQTSWPLLPPKKLSLRIFFPKIKEPLDITGEVVWSTRSKNIKKTVVLQKIGIKFSFLEEKQRKQLRQFIGQYS